MPLLKIIFWGIALLISEGEGTLSEDQTDIKQLYQDCNLEQHIDYHIFEKAIIGFRKIKDKEQTGLITIIDFGRASTADRLFIVDLQQKKLVKHSLVAHGKNSGTNFPHSFSNTSGSLKSCLGFYKTAETYYGKHGYSLRLDGLP